MSKTLTTSSLEYANKMRETQVRTDSSPNLSMSGCYGKPLSRFELFKRKIRNIISRII